MQTALSDADALVIGRIVAAYGIKGWVKVQSFTDPRENIFDYQPWFIRMDAGWQPIKLANGRLQGKGLVALLDGVVDRTDVERRLIGRDIAIARDTLPPAADDEIYWRDLIGLRVKLADGRDLGRLDRLFETGANDVMVVRGDRDSMDRQERLIPWLPGDVVGDIDTEAGTVEVDWDPEF
ncbi:ribosome maturation factor RimM [Isoalcanivorax beigongshangi]|uniref:Ribosome maturation factor RimM n=1 Tax=Isoalcanivorax beigongshangi TaxID=3238810 RepID=A0ABV4AJ19_9GAMM